LGPTNSGKRSEGTSHYKKAYSEPSRPFTPTTTTFPRYPPSLGDDKKLVDHNKNKTTEDRIATLKNYRKAKGLCFKCGEKWYPGNKCQSVSLNAMEELWALLSDDTTAPAVLTEEESDSSDDLMAISVQALNGIEGHKTMRLRGFISDQEVYILVDSDSTHCFLSEEFGSRLKGQEPLSQPVQVRVANGNLIQCTHELPNQLWNIKGVTIRNTFKILPLSSYDAVIGMDWLIMNSPMHIHWVRSGFSLTGIGTLSRFWAFSQQPVMEPEIFFSWGE
jgi:hypothetical protein